jgi:hypothetical protein
MSDGFNTQGVTAPLLYSEDGMTAEVDGVDVHHWLTYNSPTTGWLGQVMGPTATKPTEVATVVVIMRNPDGTTRLGFRMGMVDGVSHDNHGGTWDSAKAAQLAQAAR